MYNNESIIFKPGDKVTYIPEYGKPEPGIIKSQCPDKNYYFVVFHCNNDWDDYANYTGQRTHKKYLKMVLKTSEEWLKEIPEANEVEILDPDGWDRSNYLYSFFEEKITYHEFYNRLMESTIIFNENFNPLNENLNDNTET